VIYFICIGKYRGRKGLYIVSVYCIASSAKYQKVKRAAEYHEQLPQTCYIAEYWMICTFVTCFRQIFRAFDVRTIVVYRSYMRFSGIRFFSHVSSIKFINALEWFRRLLQV